MKLKFYFLLVMTLNDFCYLTDSIFILCIYLYPIFYLYKTVSDLMSLTLT